MTLLQAMSLNMFELNAAADSHRIVIASHQGLDTTGKLPVAPKSLGLPGRFRVLPRKIAQK